MTEPLHNLLEQHFDTAFAAPDGIKKLRELILTLAMQGKLVTQDPNDPPASDLLKQIEAEKQRLMKSGKIKQPKPLPPIKLEEVPYELPEGWEWVRLSELGITQTGATPPSKDRENYGDFIPFIGPGDIKNGTIDYSGEGLSEQGLSKGRLIDANSVLMVCIGGSIGKHAINKRNVTCNQQINTLTPYSSIPVKYISDIMATIYFQNALINQAGGSATPIINKQKWSVIPIPLPPLPEQHRIVAKIDQLMAKCDELEALRKGREVKRRAVHAAAIKQLLDTTSSFPRRRESSSSKELDLRSPSEREQAYGGDGISAHGWNFIQQHFGELYAVRENVTELRKAILQLAVMGKLVPQNPNDPPASQLLKEIEAEKKRLVKEGKIKAPKQLPEIKPEEVPYALPQGWCWSTLAEIALVNPRNSAPDSTESSFVPMALIGVSLEGTHGQEVRIWGDIKQGFTHFAEGDIGVAKITPCFENSKACIFSGLKNGIGAGTTELHIVRPVGETISASFVLAYLKSPPFLLVGQTKMTGTAGQKRLPKEFVESNPFPLPPLSEQHRIVAKINQLMALCDTLDQQIAAATGKQTALLDAVMAQV